MKPIIKKISFGISRLLLLTVLAGIAFLLASLFRVGGEKRSYILLSGDQLSAFLPTAHADAPVVSDSDSVSASDCDSDSDSDC